MPAITVRSTTISKVGSNEVTTLRVSVDRSLASVGGPPAGVVASGAVTVSNANFVLPSLVLYSTYNAADEITRGAIYRAELLDGAGNVVIALPSFNAFQIRIISAQTSWNEIREYNDFLAITQGLNNDNLGTNTDPTLFNSIIGILGATARASQDTISLLFGMGFNPPGIRRNVATSQMEFSHDGLTWTAMGAGGGAPITGAGTLNYIPRWTAGTVLGDSDMFYDVGTLTTVVQNNFQVNNNAVFGFDQITFNSNPVRPANAPFITLKNVAGQTGAVVRLDNTAGGGGIQNLIMPSGDLRPRGVNYTWPVANAAGVLTNDGSGGLSWTPGGGGSYSWLIAGDTGLATAVPTGGDVRFLGGNGLTSVFAALSASSFTITLAIDLLSTGGLQTSGANSQLGIRLDSVTGGGNNVAQLSADGLYVPPGGGAGTFTLAGDSGTPQTINSGDTATFVGGLGIATVAQATDQLVINVDLLSTGGLQTSGGAAQLGIKRDTVTGGGNNAAVLSSDGLYVPPGAGGSFTYQGNSGGVGTIILNTVDVLTIAGGNGCNTTNNPGLDTITIDLDLAPAQSGRPNNASIISTALYCEPREFKRTRAVTTNTALVPATDNVILVGTGSGNITVTLTTPAAGEYNNFIVKKTTTDGNSIQLAPASGQIDGAANVTFSGVIGNAGEALQIVWDGANWWIIGRA